MKVLLTIWISVVLIQEVVPSTLVRRPRFAISNTSSVQTEYEAKYEQKGINGNQSLSTVTGKHQIVHDNCSENWNVFAEKCASLIKDLISTLANAVHSNPGDATNLQLHIRNTFKHFDSTNNCTCLNDTGNSLSDVNLSPLFHNITINTIAPGINSGKVPANNNSQCSGDDQTCGGGSATTASPDCDEENGSGTTGPAVVIDPVAVAQQIRKTNGLLDPENSDVNPSNAAYPNGDSTNNSRRQATYPRVLKQPQTSSKYSAPPTGSSQPLSSVLPQDNKISVPPFLVTPVPNYLTKTSQAPVAVVDPITASGSTVNSNVPFSGSPISTSNTGNGVVSPVSQPLPSSANGNLTPNKNSVPVTLAKYQINNSPDLNNSGAGQKPIATSVLSASNQNPPLSFSDSHTLDPHVEVPINSATPPESTKPAILPVTKISNSVPTIVAPNGQKTVTQTSQPSLVASVKSNVPSTKTAVINSNSNLPEPSDSDCDDEETKTPSPINVSVPTGPSPDPSSSLITDTNPAPILPTGGDLLASNNQVPVSVPNLISEAKNIPSMPEIADQKAGNIEISVTDSQTGENCDDESVTSKGNTDNQTPEVPLPVIIGSGNGQSSGTESCDDDQGSAPAVAINSGTAKEAPIVSVSGPTAVVNEPTNGAEGESCDDAVTTPAPSDDCNESTASGSINVDVPSIGVNAPQGSVPSGPAIAVPGGAPPGTLGVNVPSIGVTPAPGYVPSGPAIAVPGVAQPGSLGVNVPSIGVTPAPVPASPAPALPVSGNAAPGTLGVNVPSIGVTPAPGSVPSGPAIAVPGVAPPGSLGVNVPSIGVTPAPVFVSPAPALPVSGNAAPGTVGVNVPAVGVTPAPVFVSPAPALPVSGNAAPGGLDVNLPSIGITPAPGSVSSGPAIAVSGNAAPGNLNVDVPSIGVTAAPSDDCNDPTASDSISVDAPSLGLPPAPVAVSAGPAIAVSGNAAPGSLGVDVPSIGVTPAPVSISGTLPGSNSAQPGSLKASLPSIGVTPAPGSLSSGPAIAVSGVAPPESLGVNVPPTGVTPPPGSVSSGPAIAVSGNVVPSSPDVYPAPGSVSSGPAIAVSGNSPLNVDVPSLEVTPAPVSLSGAVSGSNNLQPGSLTANEPFVGVTPGPASVSSGPAIAVSGNAVPGSVAVNVPSVGVTPAPGSVSSGPAIAVSGNAAPGGLDINVPTLEVTPAPVSLSGTGSNSAQPGSLNANLPSLGVTPGPVPVSVPPVLPVSGNAAPGTVGVNVPVVEVTPAPVPVSPAAVLPVSGNTAPGTLGVNVPVVEVTPAPVFVSPAPALPVSGNAAPGTVGVNVPVVEVTPAPVPVSPAAVLPVSGNTAPGTLGVNVPAVGVTPAPVPVSPAPALPVSGNIVPGTLGVNVPTVEVTPAPAPVSPAPAFPVSGNAAPGTVGVNVPVVEVTPAPAPVSPTPTIGLSGNAPQSYNPVLLRPTTFQTTSVDPTPPPVATYLPPTSTNPLTNSFVPKYPGGIPLTQPSTSPKTPTHHDDEDDEEDCCSCESCTEEEEIIDPKQYKENACKNLEEARLELKKIFDKITKKLKCGRKAPQTITTR